MRRPETLEAASKVLKAAPTARKRAVIHCWNLLVEVLDNDSGLTYNCGGHQDNPKRKEVASSSSKTNHKVFNNAERGDL